MRSPCETIIFTLHASRSFAWLSHQGIGLVEKSCTPVRSTRDYTRPVPRFTKFDPHVYPTYCRTAAPAHLPAAAKKQQSAAQASRTLSMGSSNSQLLLSSNSSSCGSCREVYTSRCCIRCQRTASHCRHCHGSGHGVLSSGPCPSYRL